MPPFNGGRASYAESSSNLGEGVCLCFFFCYGLENAFRFFIFLSHISSHHNSYLVGVEMVLIQHEIKYGKCVLHYWQGKLQGEKKKETAV